MFAKLKHLLKTSKPESVSEPQTSEKTFDEYLRDEVWDCPYIHSEFKQHVIHAISDRTYLKIGNELSTEEKKAMGLRVRKKIYKAQVEALTHDGLMFGPSNLFSDIRNRAFHCHARASHLSKIREAGFKGYRFIPANDERDCAWCKNNAGRKFNINVNIESLIKDNCSCDYCRATISPERS